MSRRADALSLLPALGMIAGGLLLLALGRALRNT